MATRTSTATGNLSAGGTWVGGVAPVDDDLIVIATGHTVTVDIDISLGSNGSGVGDAVTIQATDQTTFGKLIVADGVVLTLKGFGTTSNRAMLINRYAQFEPAPGATIRVDCASNYQTIIDNRGIVNAIGTSPKPIIWDIPSANYSWNNDIAAEAFSDTSWKFDTVAKVACAEMVNIWISNAAGTGIGSFGDSSVSFSSENPATILQTEVATRDAVNSVGEYYIDYDMGYIWFYHDSADGNPTFTITYKYLTNTKGWGINSVQNTTYNEAKFDYCNFSYMGPSTAADNRAVKLQFKQTAAVAANRLAYVKRCNFNYCYEPLALEDCTGTLADPILIDGNTFGACGGSGAFGATITMYREVSTYVSIINNTFRSGRSPIITFLQFGDSFDFTGWKIEDNTVLTASDFVRAPALLCRLPDSTIANNTIDGVGSANDYRVVASCGGTSGSPLVVSDNLIRRVMRACHYSSYLQFERNIIDRVYHHGFVGPTEDDLLLTDITCQNNLFIGEAGAGINGYDASPFIETGYNHRLHIDNFKAINNTMVGNPSGIFGFGDIQDGSTYTICTRLVVANNLGKMTTAGTSKAWQRNANDADEIWRGHVLQFDYNLDHNYTTRYTNLSRQGTFARSGVNYSSETIATRNIPGVALYDPNFSSASGKVLDFTYASATDQQLTFDGGTAKQLVITSGTATAGANTTTSGVVGAYNGTLTDSGATFPTTKTDANCPQCHWVKITGGTGSGQIRAITNNTGTVLTCVPAWSVVPDATSTYAVIRSEVQLVDGADTVQAGIYLPDLPTATAQDTGIDFADHSVTGSDPLLVDAAGEDAIDYKIATGSPAIDVATADYAPAADYFATARPQGAADDIGAHEFQAGGDLLLRLQADGLQMQGGLL